MPSIDDSKCILITGGTAGIGRALALALVKLPSKPRVIVVGRRKSRLEELAKSGLETVELDMNTDSSNLKKFADSIVQKYPELDAVIYNAGVQYEHYFRDKVNIDKLTSEININYISIVTSIYHFMPHFLKISEGHPTFIYTVTSCLATLPVPHVLNYCASKAALHSFTTSLRIQLQDTNINVIEIAPPLVESELHDDAGTTDKLSNIWMPLDQYISTTLDGLRKGDKLVTCGGAADMFKRFEEGKEEIVQNRMKSRRT
ncbi:hypothetical protein F5887DRAFT_80359 [Amanita rubescens]|nr:hypothetical protein F5887DRAFT_80359 [Amanita rubescens]